MIEAHGFAAGTSTCHRRRLGQSVFPRPGASPWTIDTLSGAPNTVAVANIDEQLPLSVTPSATQDAFRNRDSLLLHYQKVDFDTQQRKSDFATRDAKLEGSLQEHLSDSMPRKRTSHVSHNTPTPKFYLTRRQPTQFWGALEGIPVGTLVEEIKRKRRHTVAFTWQRTSLFGFRSFERR